LSTLEAVSLLAYASAVTSTIRLGCAVIQTAVRGPVLMAKTLATIDQLCEGRLLVGVGLGSHPDFFAAQGLSAARRGARYSEGLRLMRALWTDDVVTFDGDFYQVTDRRMEPKPVQKPCPPLIFGGIAPASLARAAQMGDGFIAAGTTTTDAFVALAATMREEIAKAERDPERFSIGKRVFVIIDDDRERARDQLRAWCDAWYGNADLADQSGVFGSVATCVDELHRVVDAGATMILANPISNEVEQMEILAHEVIPKLREGSSL
jgi:alkanesulfonate monooxygenase SsuD/methylene tetrahydromethanopterin reductase-like flavin-dependent oxidoreductase (luciferase family)